MLGSGGHLFSSSGHFRKLAGAFFFFSFFILCIYRWNYGQITFYLLLALRHLLAGIYILKRPASTYQATKFETTLAFSATIIPFLYIQPELSSVQAVQVYIANLLAICGYGLAIFSLIELGNRFGISPAIRGPRCSTGPYAILNHPMYVGYAIAEASWLVLNLKNIPIYALSMGMQLARAKLENRILLKDKISGK